MSDIQVAASRLRPPSWRDPRLLVGVLIVLASVAVGARVVAAADDTVPVYAAAGPMSSGHALTTADLRVVRVRLGGGTARYLSGAASPPSGLVLIRPLGAGELVPSSAVAPASVLQRRPVSVPITGPPPEGLTAGATVDLWSSARDQGAGATTYRPPVRIARGAEVFAVSTPSAGLAATGTAAVQVLLREEELREVLDALANGARLAVVPAPGSVPDAPASLAPADPAADPRAADPTTADPTTEDEDPATDPGRAPSGSSGPSG